MTPPDRMTDGTRAARPTFSGTAAWVDPDQRPQRAGPRTPPSGAFPATAPGQRAHLAHSPLRWTANPGELIVARINRPPLPQRPSPVLGGHAPPAARCTAPNQNGRPENRSRPPSRRGRDDPVEPAKLACSQRWVYSRPGFKRGEGAWKFEERPLTGRSSCLAD